MIRARCPECGDVWLSHATVTVIWRHGRLTYRFDCPWCATRTERDTTERIAGMLAGVGCSAEWDPPFTDRDVTRFRAQLDRADWASLLHA